jgi:endonuclease YncB( thermonuclease family)
MSKSKELTVNSKNNSWSEEKYQKLLNDLSNLIVAGKEQAEQIANQSINNLYHQIGRRICEEEIINQNLGQNLVLNNLTDDLNLERTTLSRAVNFFKTYPNYDPEKNTFLTWSHYKYLIAIKDAKVRKSFEEKSKKEKWTSLQLSNAIKGFSGSEDEQAAMSENNLTRPTAPTYLYKAKVEKIVDGDTLILLIDLGFQVFKQQRIRLAGIDAFELKTKEGKKAKEFVRKKLQHLEFVMVKTHKIDIYGRFIGHIFYDETEAKNKDDIFLSGVYLNEEIVKAKMAIKVNY